jgi:uncharacterized BrkB/YihY/UPF0761 family membrane protein
LVNIRGEMVMKIKYRYLGLFTILLMLEIYIGLFVHDNIIRPFVGDALVVGVIYFFLRSFMNKRKFLFIYVFLFACLIEVGQYFNLVYLLHLENYKAARIIIGSTFDLNDIFCYFIGTIFIFVYEVTEDCINKKVYNKGNY